MRRTPILRWLAAAVALSLVVVSCGGADRPEEAVAVGVLSDVERAPADPSADRRIAGEAMTAFGMDLFAAVLDTGGDGNVIVSPASVAIALAMMEPGASGEAQTQVRELLHIDDPAAFHASMSAFEQELEGRAPMSSSSDGEPGELVARIANAAYLQEGYPFDRVYLDAIGRSYGPVLHDVDFQSDPDAVAHTINDFVAEATEDRITDLIGDGTLKADTVLTLVNALYLRASWETVFEVDATEADHAFTRPDGSTVAVPLMVGEADGSAQGDGWVGATKSYVGGLAIEFVLPDEGRFADVSARLGDAFSTFVTDPRGGASLSVPRFETRYRDELTPALKTLGLTAPYAAGGLLGIADDPELILDQVIHETYLAMDEQGTEAAAATAMVFRATGAPIEPPAPVVLDRPFFFRIVDRSIGATLFLGQVLDPTA
jgi:serpin B